MREYYLKFFLMISHLNSHRTTDIKPEMLSGVQTGNGTPHDKYNTHGIAHGRTNWKEDIFVQRQLVQNFTFTLEWGKGLVHWLSRHGAGHIPGIFFLHAAYSALRHFCFMSKIMFSCFCYLLFSPRIMFSWSSSAGSCFKTPDVCFFLPVFCFYSHGSRHLDYSDSVCSLHPHLDF